MTLPLLVNFCDVNAHPPAAVDWFDIGNIENGIFAGNSPGSIDPRNKMTGE
jgi:hypothetical protein